MYGLAGLVGSYHVVYNRYLRDRLERESESTHYNDCNVLSMHALIGAYSDAGSEWTDQMIETVSGNLNYACDFIEENFPGVKTMRPQGTYMLYLDCGEWCRNHGVGIGELQRRGVKCGVIWQDGEAFIWPDTIRMNLACPLSCVKEAMDRLRKYAFI